MVLNSFITMSLLGTVLSLHAPLVSVNKFHSQIIRNKIKNDSFIVPFTKHELVTFVKEKMSIIDMCGWEKS